MKFTLECRTTFFSFIAVARYRTCCTNKQDTISRNQVRSVRCPLVWFTLALATFSNVTFYGYKPFYNMSYSLRSSCQGVPLDDSALWIGRHPLPVLEAGTHGEVLRAEAEAAQDPLRV